jgi:hypothetical protein
MLSQSYDLRIIHLHAFHSHESVSLQQLLVILILIVLSLQELRRRTGPISKAFFRNRKAATDLDEWLSGLDKMTFTLGDGALLRPVNNGLIRDTIFVVKYLEDLRERLDDPSLGITVYLDRTSSA